MSTGPCAFGSRHDDAMVTVAATPCGDSVSTTLENTSGLRTVTLPRARCASDARSKMLSLPCRVKTVPKFMPALSASAMRCSPSIPSRSPGWGAFPLNDARSAFTRAFDLLVIGAPKDIRLV